MRPLAGERIRQLLYYDAKVPEGAVIRGADLVLRFFEVFVGKNVRGSSNYSIANAGFTDVARREKVFGDHDDIVRAPMPTVMDDFVNPGFAHDGTSSKNLSVRIST